MRLYSILIAVCCVNVPVFAQWTDLNSTRRDIVFINATTGWMAGGEGSLQKTTDGGKTWINQNSPIEYGNEVITKIAVFDDGNSLKVVTRKSGLSAVYTSSDAGATWKRAAFSQFYNFDFHFINASTGWYWEIPEGYNTEAVYRTTDGGDTWTPVPGLTSVVEMTSIGNNVWAIQRLYGGNTQAVLWKSPDLGSAWTSSVIDAAFFWDYYMPDLQFLDSQQGWLCTKIEDGLYKSLYKTTNGGTSWTPITDPIFYNVRISEMLFLTADLGYVYGLNFSANKHLIYKTTNGGTSWTMVNSRDYTPGVSAPDDINALYFKDINTGVAIGDNGFYMETTDGGATWDIKNYCTIGSNFPANDIAFNGDDVWVVGEHLVQTSGDGVSWTVFQNLLVSVMYEESAVAFRGNGKGIMVTDLTYLRTTDNGATWNSFTPTFEYTGDIYNNRMWYDPKGNVWIEKANATLYKSEDDGQTFKIAWRTTSLLGSDRELAFQTDKKIWYYGETKLVKSADGGATWKESNESIQQLQFISEDIGYKLKEDRKIYKTTDGGEHWTFLSSVTHWSTFQFMYFADENVGWVGSTLGIIMKTVDGGKTWTDEYTGMLNEYYDMAFARNSHGKIMGYLVGDGVLKLSTDYTPQPVFTLGEIVTSITSSGDTFINLTWTDNSSIEDGFIIQRKPAGTEDAFTTIGTTTSTTFNDNTVESGKTYIYRVAIYKTDRATHYSNEVTGPKFAQQIVFQEIPQKTIGDPNFTLVATNSSGLPIEFTSSNGSVASIAGNTVMIQGVGEVIITANAASTIRFLPAEPVTRTLIVQEKVITGLERDKNQLNVYPNPVQDKLVLDMSAFSSQGVTLEIIDNSGRQLKKIASARPSVEIAVTDLPAGNYIVNAVAGTHHVTLHFVKN